MVTIHATYEGSLRCTATHEPSATTLSTDAPRDNQGLGASFSPTDLIATGLLTCAITTIGIVARRDGIPIRSMRGSVVKGMASDPRRIRALPVELEVTGPLSAVQRHAVEETGRTCPVARSIHPEVDAPMTFVFRDA